MEEAALIGVSIAEFLFFDTVLAIFRSFVALFLGEEQLSRRRFFWFFIGCEHVINIFYQ